MKFSTGKLILTILAGLSFILHGPAFSSELMVQWNALEVRERINKKIMDTDGQVFEVKSVEDQVVVNDNRKTPIRIYHPLSEKEKKPAILFIHGGAWIAGSIETHENISRYLSNKTGAVVILVGYLNAPEARFPHQLEQSYDVLNWMTDNAAKLDINIDKVIVAGDSAGGNMGAALCLLSRDRKGPKIHFQVLINPAPNLTETSTVLQLKDNGVERWFVKQYVDDLKVVMNPYVSPIKAESLKGVPPAVIILAELDDLFEDGMQYAKKLIAEGVETEIFTQNGIGHLAGDAARVSLKAIESLEVVVKSINSFLGNEGI